MYSESYIVCYVRTSLSKLYEHYYAFNRYFHSALDPAFNETDYAKYEITGQGPAYTEPYVVFNFISQNTTTNIFTLKHRYWEGDYGPTLGVRIYLSDQGTFEWVTFVFGVLFFASCFYVSTRIQREMLKRKVL